MSHWKPEGYNSLSPYLICEQAEELIAFMQKAFGATALRQIRRPDGSLMHGEVRIDDSVVMVGGAKTDAKSSDIHLHIYVKDVNKAYEKALAAGAQKIEAPQRKTEGDDNRCGVRDAWGHSWWLATQ